MMELPFYYYRQERDGSLTAAYRKDLFQIQQELAAAVEEALEARELIKLHVLKNCFEDGRALANQLAEATYAEVVQVIGKKIVLYREARDPKKRKIVLPK